MRGKYDYRKPEEIKATFAQIAEGFRLVAEEYAEQLKKLGKAASEVHIPAPSLRVVSKEQQDG